MSVVRAPWTPEQVRSLNEYQRSDVWHEFTCGTCGTTLLAWPDGWRCGLCPYTQDWAHGWMADGSWRTRRLFP